MLASHFISDNRFFLYGLQKTIAHIRPNANFIMVSDADGAHNFNPAHGDIVVLAISSPLLRREFMKKRSISKTRLIIMLDQYITISKRNHFPRLLAKKTTPEELNKTIEHALYSEINLTVLPGKRRDVIRQLSKGQAPESIARTYGVSEKSIYFVKRDVLFKYGIERRNAVTTILCQDILEWIR
ncbi:TPA: hypothetical protein SLG40_004026 [Serratia odorifera]|nr:hypothetical protein [Serratia odorifera]